MILSNGDCGANGPESTLRIGKSKRTDGEVAQHWDGNALPKPGASYAQAEASRSPRARGVSCTDFIRKPESAVIEEQNEGHTMLLYLHACTALSLVPKQAAQYLSVENIN